MRRISFPDARFLHPFLVSRAPSWRGPGIRSPAHLAESADRSREEGRLRPALRRAELVHFIDECDPFVPPVDIHTVNNCLILYISNPLESKPGSTLCLQSMAGQARSPFGELSTPNGSSSPSRADAVASGIDPGMVRDRVGRRVRCRRPRIPPEPAAAFTAIA